LVNFVLIRMTLTLTLLPLLTTSLRVSSLPLLPPPTYSTLLSHHASLHLSSLGDSHCTAPTSLHFTALTTLPPLTALPSLVLMQILKRTGIYCRERRLISKLYMDLRVKVRLDRGETRSVQIGRGVRQGCCLLPILFDLYSECLTKEALDGLGGFNIGGQIIPTVKYADDLVPTAKEETVLQSMIDKLIEIGRCYGMEMNVEKTKVMRISR